MTIELEDRRKALEDAFFQKENDALLQKMRAKRESAAAREELASQCGIRDEAVLDALLAQGVDAESLAALNLVPVVAVAWADGKVTREERKAVLEAAAENGVQPGQQSYELLENWLNTRPADRLMVAWCDYAGHVFGMLNAPDGERFAADVLSRAEKIAQAAGGILGIGSVSKAERAVLDRVKAALS